ncbi:MAG: response regulator transcription factor [Oscillospiraceae bacterium]|nr:response regulator transcription factor [Oscillospiraceae bacterium]
MFSVLVCEDDKNIRRLMTEYLIEDGYTVIECRDGAEALESFGQNHIDLLITDVMMPETDGFELVRELRDAGFDTPVLMITARGTMEDKKTGFGCGADDYMVKPFDMEEMLLRAAALLRRAGTASEKRLSIGNTVLDYNTFSASSSGETVYLPNKEFQILFKLLSQPDRIFTRTQLMDEIWGYDNDSTQRTVDVHIRRLREKFENSLDFEIVTVKGLGYKAVKKDKNITT